jgi:PAS domain S-box-containing protein
MENSLLGPGQTVPHKANSAKFASGMFVTFALMGIIELLSATAYAIPNAGVVMLLGVVYSAYTGGTACGLVSAGLAALYVGWNFSEPGAPFHFSSFNRSRLAVLSLVAGVMALMVGTLRHCSRLLDQAKRRNAELQAQLTAHARLGQTQRLATAVFETAHEGIMVTDKDNLILAVNPAFTRITGYTLEEVRGKDPRVLKSGQHDSRFYQAMWASIAATGRWQGELWNRRKNGERYCQWLSICATRSDQGVTEYYVAILTDITDLRKLQAALEQSNERLKRSQHHANIGSWDWNIETGELHWSERVRPLFGYSEGAIETTYANFLNAVHPEDRQHVLESVDACVKDGAAYDIEHRVVWPDGTVRWLQERGDVVRAHDGRPLRMLGVVQDVTSRKLGEAALRDSEARFRQLAEHIRDVFWIRDTVTDRVLYVSPAYEQIWGRKLTDFDTAYRSLLESIHPEDRPALLARLQEAGRADGEMVSEYRILRPDGALRWIRSRAFPILNESGQVFRVVGIAEDVTDVKQAEEQRIAQAILQRESLVREVHHRIKNNLQAVAGLLMRHAGEYPGLDVPLREAMGQVQTVAVIHGIQANADDHAILLCEMVVAITTVVRNLAQFSFPVDVEVLVDRPVEVAQSEAVPVALILNELLTNAVKHSVCRRDDTVRLVVSAAGGGARVLIENPGSLPRALDLDSGAGVGTGLGLVRALLPRRGAKISMHSGNGVVRAVLKLDSPAIQNVSMHRRLPPAPSPTRQNLSPL